MTCDRASTAILLVDVINSFQFPGGASLLKKAERVGGEIANLCRMARRQKIPVIYANDNFGRWRSNFKEIVDYCDKGAASRFVSGLRPHSTDYFVLKPKNSAFYATSLDLLLEHIGVRRLVIAGLLTDNCVLFSAHEAYVRDYKITIPRDCVVALEEEHSEQALSEMQRVLKADIRPWKVSLHSIVSRK